MDPYAIFVDAGHLYLAAGGHLQLAGKLSPDRAKLRSATRLNFAETRHALIKESARIVDSGSLRTIYWYDAAVNRRPHPEHAAIAKLPLVKLRLGSLRYNADGVYQKGVDALIVRDLIVYAIERSFSDVLLISGDEDLLEGVGEAQQRGIRVHLLSFKVPTTALADALKHEAHTTSILEHTFFEELCEPMPVFPAFPEVGGTYGALICELNQETPVHYGYADCGKARWYFERDMIDPRYHWDRLHVDMAIAFEIQALPTFDRRAELVNAGTCANVRPLAIEKDSAVSRQT